AAACANTSIRATSGGCGLVTRDEALSRTAPLRGEQAREGAPWSDHREVGYTYRMGPLNAAAGLAQFSDLNKNVARRRAIFDEYRSLLKHKFTFVAERAGVISNRWLSTVVLDEEVDVEAVVRGMKEKGIECRHLWRPMHNQGVFKNPIFEKSGVSMYLFTHGMTLPSGNMLTNSEVALVSKKLQEVKGGK